jgi:hypothetical protein
MHEHFEAMLVHRAIDVGKLINQFDVRGDFARRSERSAQHREFQQIQWYVFLARPTQAPTFR